MPITGSSSIVVVLFGKIAEKSTLEAQIFK